jgi:hypothetical protein
MCSRFQPAILFASVHVGTLAQTALSGKLINLIHPRSAQYERGREKQIPERQGEVLLLRGWKSLKFGARSPKV